MVLCGWSTNGDSIAPPWARFFFRISADCWDGRPVNAVATGATAAPRPSHCRVGNSYFTCAVVAAAPLAAAAVAVCVGQRGGGVDLGCIIAICDALRSEEAGWARCHCRDSSPCFCGSRVRVAVVQCVGGVADGAESLSASSQLAPLQ